MKTKPPLLKSIFCFTFTYLISISGLFAQSGSITGRVTTINNQSAPGVVIQIQELKKSTSSNDKGVYTFKNIKAGKYTLVASFLGLKSEMKAVDIAAGQHVNIDFVLSETSEQLKEVRVKSGKTLNNRPVSIGKTDINPMDLPQSTGVVPEKVIKDQQVNRVGDAIRNVSGVSLTQTRGGVAETFTARGYSIGIGGGSGSIFKNGVLTNTAGFPEASALESVEVLKGSAALLYGNVSGGLVINMITKKPKFENGGSVSMRYGSYNMYKPTVDVYGPVSNNLAFRVVGVYENDGSYRNHVYTERTYVNPSLLYKLGSKTTLLLEGDFLKSNLTPDFGIGSLNNGKQIPTMVPRGQYINTIWAYSHINQYTGSLTLNHCFNDTWRLNFITSAQGTSIDSYQASLPNTANAVGDWNRGLQRANTFEGDYTGQLNLNGKFYTGSVKHQLLLGSDVTKVLNVTNAYAVNGKNISSYVYDKINIIDLNKYQQRTDIPEAIDTARTHAPVYRFGAYAQDLINITDQLKVLAGLRWSWQQTSQTTINYLVKGTSGNGAAANKYDRAFSPKVALIYEPYHTTSVYATYSNNFIINTGTDVTGNALKPSLVDQYEAGIKNEFCNGKLSANFSIYRIVNNNLAVTDPNNTAYRMLSGQTTSDGFEVDLNGSFSENFYFIAGYGYNNARYTKTSGLLSSNIEGERLVVNPKQTANGSLFYTFPNTIFKGIKLGASVFYTGDRLAGFNSVYQKNSSNQLVINNRTIPVGGFTTLDLTAGYSWHKISLLAAITNVTNTLNYLIHDNYSITPIPPRQFITTLSYKF